MHVLLWSVTQLLYVCFFFFPGKVMNGLTHKEVRQGKNAAILKFFLLFCLFRSNSELQS